VVFFFFFWFFAPETASGSSLVWVFASPIGVQFQMEPAKDSNAKGSATGNNNTLTVPAKRGTHRRKSSTTKKSLSDTSRRDLRKILVAKLTQIWESALNDLSEPRASFCKFCFSFSGLPCRLQLQFPFRLPTESSVYLSLLSYRT
jgi:hypothetical protein